MRDTFDADLLLAGIPKWKLIYRWIKPELYLVRLLRAAEARRSNQKTPLRKMTYLYTRMRFESVSRRFGFTIPLGVFAPGLSIAHLGTIVVNRDARVGRRCRLHPGVTIGATRGQSPIIGDDVFLAPGCGVYGAITIGNRVHVGPGVIVTTDVPDDTVLFAPRPVQRPRGHPTWYETLHINGPTENWPEV